MNNCPHPKLCELLGQHIHGRRFEIWRGVNIDSRQAQSYRNRWCSAAGVTLTEALKICDTDARERAAVVGNRMREVAQLTGWRSMSAASFCGSSDDPAELDTLRLQTPSGAQVSLARLGTKAGERISVSVCRPRPGTDWTDPAAEAEILDDLRAIKIEVERIPGPHGRPVLVICEPEPSLPPLMAQATNFLTSGIRHVIHGMPQASAETQAERLALCRQCDQYRPSDERCAACGCGVADKASWAMEVCPKGKWSANGGGH